MSEIDAPSGPKLFKLAVSGSRTITDRAFVFQTLDRHAATLLGDGLQLEIHLGDAAGVDALALQWARERNLDRLIYFADRSGYDAWRARADQTPDAREGGTLVSDWLLDGRMAGPFRNHAMITGCNLLVAIWDGTSLGTRNAIMTARNLFVRTFIYRPLDGSVEVSENTRASIGQTVVGDVERAGKR